MKVVINSHNKSKVALEHLLESMKEVECEIIVVIGGYYEKSEYEIINRGKMTYILANHNSIDYTGLIALLEIYSKTEEYYFYIHDTCKVGKTFYKKLKEIDLTGVTTIKINRRWSMNIGIYSQKIINENSEFLLSKKNIKESECMKYKSINYQEDYIFNSDKNNKILDNYDGWIHSKPVDYYKTGTMRIVEYYPNIDIYKMKANWGHDNWTLKN